ncbi:MAG: PEP-CTERM sorting domain-containing protein [Planctomycetes bacterium]|nr:PEP-CTERM sorting domain-containing protein [Planctomycetota bacterium]
MRERTTRRMLLTACVVALPLAAAHLAHADTVDVVHDGYGAYDTTLFWGAGYDGYDAMSGVYMLNKTGSTGAGDTWRNGQIPAFCMELQEPAPKTTTTYSVTVPENVYNSYTGETLGRTKGSYLRELWARYYDPAWASGSYTAQDNRAAQAFAAAVWEIIYEKMPTAAADWDVTLDGTVGLGGFKAENLDYETANKWLHSLTGAGPRADLRVLVSNGNQEYLVAVPEPATAILLGLGGLLGVARRRRRNATVRPA